VNKPLALLFSLLALASSAQTNLVSTNSQTPVVAIHKYELQRLVEERDFVARFSKFYEPRFWIDYKDTLYFEPKDDEQIQCFQVLPSVLAKYSVLTNKMERYKLVAKLVEESGAPKEWQAKVLVPLSNPQKQKYILPMFLDKPLNTMKKFKLLQSFESGDALTLMSGR
jgi:hypothetical protein